MATPREILDRANRNQSNRVQPPAAVPQQEENLPQRTMTVQPVRKNSVYRQLMVNHDRVHTRHLKG